MKSITLAAVIWFMATQSIAQTRSDAEQRLFYF